MKMNLFVENEKHDKKKFVTFYHSMECTTHLAVYVDFPESPFYKAC